MGYMTNMDNNVNVDNKHSIQYKVIGGEAFLINANFDSKITYVQRFV